MVKNYKNWKENYQVRQAAKADLGYFGSIPGIANGWFSTEDAVAYQELVSPISNGIVLELGSYEGLSLYYIKDICKANNTKLISVDFIAYDKLVENTKEWGIDFINLQSSEASDLFPDEYFDLVFLDGDHHKEAMMSDIEGWLPKIKKEGVLAGHDFNLNHLKRGIQHWFDIKKVNTKSNVWWYREPLKYLNRPFSEISKSTFYSK
jgi:cephalosporin hydroxylase